MVSAFFKFFLQCHRLYNSSSQLCLSVLTLLMCPIFFLLFFSFLVALTTFSQSIKVTTIFIVYCACISFYIGK